MPTRIKIARTIDDDVTTLKTFVAERQDNWKIVRENLALLQNEYKNYLDDFANCKRYRILEPRRFSTCSARLRKLYDQTPNCLGHIGEFRRRANQMLSVCPYCGLPMARVTLDHYLPRYARGFPHLSILSCNLVPACDACQSKKGNASPVLRRLSYRSERRPKTLRVRGKRAEFKRTIVKMRPAPKFLRRVSRFLHPYFDDFIEDIVWKLDPISITEPLKTLTLVPVALDSKQASLVRYQIDRLGLQARFRDEVSRWVRFSVKIFRDNNITTVIEARAVAGILLESYRVRDLTPNGMACTFFRALREHTVVADAIIQLAAIAVPVKTVRSRAVELW
ncbi:MAG: hypothetical protein PCALPYG88_7326 [uncultured Paraburkholderia sp.]|uniref:hypothetical protein n=1 Tax=uncultured Paraburkholderia sp. TaxID=1822466 RepID=UPI0025942D08|nr:hypothetical protein [uncultured Paraburkholderia sp.]CAH2904344.1 MAG: hypothetical protein PCALPYG08_7334 [uncultured Paraburkholderia sp.]CAH2943234.1 MAG: hypothetical protein PCALPYG88_7326 [uncultured Paraburkholderia sp.]